MGKWGAYTLWLAFGTAAMEESKPKLAGGDPIAKLAAKLRAYGLYTYDVEGRLIGPAVLVCADDDAQAIEQARKFSKSRKWSPHALNVVVDPTQTLAAAAARLTT